MFMNVDDLWMFMDVFKNVDDLWMFMDDLWMFMDVYGCLWQRYAEISKVHRPKM